MTFAFVFFFITGFICLFFLLFNICFIVSLFVCFIVCFLDVFVCLDFSRLSVAFIHAILYGVFFFPYVSVLHHSFQKKGEQ